VLIEGKIVVAAPIHKLWDAILEEETLRECVPGAETIERIDEHSYDCVIKQQVGPVSVRFKLRNLLTKVEPPTHLEMEGEGVDMGKAGRFVHRTSIDLVENERGDVEVSYRSEVSIVGKLAMFGERIMAAKARAVEEEFAAALRQRLESVC
jgi:carbon monoxide dehydrogenase subunit G